MYLYVLRRGIFFIAFVDEEEQDEETYVDIDGPEAPELTDISLSLIKKMTELDTSSYVYLFSHYVVHMFMCIAD